MMLAAGPDQQEKMGSNLSFSYFYQTAVLSAALALQNANLTAESMGLGAVIIGGINEALPGLDEWLGLPDFVIPLVGLAVGVPDEVPEQKPRLPRSAVFFKTSMIQILKQRSKDMTGKSRSTTARERITNKWQAGPENSSPCWIKICRWMVIRNT